MRREIAISNGAEIGIHFKTHDCRRRRLRTVEKPTPRLRVSAVNRVLACQLLPLMFFQTIEAAHERLQASTQQNRAQRTRGYKYDQHRIAQSVVAMKDVLREPGYRRRAQSQADQVEDEEIHRGSLAAHVGRHHLLDRRRSYSEWRCRQDAG